MLENDVDEKKHYGLNYEKKNTPAFLSSGMDHAPPCTAKTRGAPGISGYHGTSEYILILVGGFNPYETY